MVKEWTPKKKSALVTESMRYRDAISGRLVKGAVKALQLKFGKISKRSIMRFRAEYKRQEKAGVLSN